MCQHMLKAWSASVSTRLGCASVPGWGDDARAAEGIPQRHDCRCRNQVVVAAHIARDLRMCMASLRTISHIAAVIGTFQLLMQDDKHQGLLCNTGTTPRSILPNCEQIRRISPA